MEVLSKLGRLDLDEISTKENYPAQEGAESSGSTYKNFSVGILGHGNYGKAFAARLKSVGVSFAVGTRNLEGRHIDMENFMSYKEAVEKSDVVILAIPFQAYDEVIRPLADIFKGKIVVDVSNAEKSDGICQAEYLENLLESSHIVKSFNTISAWSIENDVYGTSINTYVCGNDAESRQRVMQLAQAMGFTPLERGWLRVAEALEKKPPDVSLLESPDTRHSLTVPDELQELSLEALKQRLIKAGESPGPITANTRNIYLRRLARIEAGIVKKDDDSEFADYLPELRQELKMISTNDYSNFEKEMSAAFDSPHKNKWREGTQKTSFNYILLDPRVTSNLFERARNLSETDIFRCFVRSIFYIGKGKESRPYGHLHEAVKMKKLNLQETKVSDKLKMILNIWQSGFGVVSLHLFHTVIPVEAYTREACMIEAFGLARLTNLKKGDFYGPASSWNSKKKRQLGIHLLKKALKIFLVEGEKQIREQDL